MKNKFIKVISSVLILTLLLSCFGIFSFAAGGLGEEEVDDSIKLLVQRAYDEGWGYSNGFTSAVGGNKYTIEYEETEDWGYNYFTRVEAGSTAESYFEFKYGTNAPKIGNSVFEVDVKVDDDTNIGNIISVKGDNKSFPIVNISDNKLSVIRPGLHTVDTAEASYYIGNAGEEWIHLAFVFTVNQKRCPVCSKVHTLAENQATDEYICCSADDGGVPVSQMEGVSGIRIYFSNSTSFDYKNAKNAINLTGEKDLSKTYYINASLDAVSSLDSFRFGTPKTAGIIGMSYLIDNVKVYNNSAVPVNFPSDKYGENVDPDQAKTEQIISGESGKTSLQYINEGLVMKVGSDWCLEKGVRTPIATSEDSDGNTFVYGAPVKVDGEVFVPIEAILNWIGYPMYTHEDGKSIDISTENGSTFVTVGRPTATANDKIIELGSAPGYASDVETGNQYIVIAMNDVEKIFEGYHVTYDEMGIICISTGAELFDRTSKSDVTLMLDILKQFIYESLSADEYYEGVKEFTESFTHPYIIATQEDFDNLNKAYLAEEGAAGYDANLKAYIAGVLAEADAIYAELTTAAEGDVAVPYTYLKREIVNPYAAEENNDYSMMTGQLLEAAEYNAKIRTLAIAHQITRTEDSKYAHLAYEFAVSMGKWQHWGPAYFINCADATAAYAMAYDWLYNDWKALGYDLSVVETALYTKGVYMGYRSTTGQECTDLRNEDDMSAYVDSTDSWNVVSTSGMVIGSLALLGVNDLATAEGRPSEVYADYVANSKYLLENNIASLMAKGLDLYAPDGSFLEGVDYWSYATGALSTLSWALSTAYGDDLGLMNAAGVDSSFYFALNTEFPSWGDHINAEFDFETSKMFHKWNYHGSWNAYASTDMFFYAATALEDEALAALRLGQLDAKDPSIWDLLAYDSSFEDLDPASVQRELDYVFYNLEGVASRSDFEDGGIYVGIMGNRNDALYGQMDSGNFIYANKNFTWFTDFGRENYGVNKGDDPLYRYGYYMNGAEGSNTLFVTSSANDMPHGQVEDGGGTIEEYGSNEYGMYAILDNSSAYSSSVISSAKRGLLFTNDRKTVVIQDELYAKSYQSYVWIAHTGITQKISLDTDGRTAYLQQRINGVLTWIRVSIVSDYTSMVFTVGNCTDTFLECYASTYSTKAGKMPERDRSMYQTLLIEWEGIDFKGSIVIEEVETDEDDLPVGYNNTALNDWSIDLVKESYATSDSTNQENAALEHITVNGQNALDLLDNNYAFNTRTEEFFYNMVYAGNAIKQYGHTNVIDKDDREMIAKYEVALGQYNTFRTDMNAICENSALIAKYLTGYHG